MSDKVVRFIKSPIVAEAIQYDGSKESFDAIWKWMGGNLNPDGTPDKTGWTHGDAPVYFSVDTPRGLVAMPRGCWIVKDTGEQGVFNVYNPDEFKEIYDQVEKE